MFKRKVWDELKHWKDNWAGRYAVLVEGPRRVGKTTIVREFVKSEYRSSIVIDFSQNDPVLKMVFEEYRTLDEFFGQLQDLTGTTLYERQSAIVFDEVQLYPKARQMIKHLVEDGRYDYIETGSLISIKQNVRNILIPSEEMTVQMRPMDFQEFMWATGTPFPVDYLRRCFDEGAAVSRAIHEEMMGKFAVYMAVGGMPQCIAEYVRTGRFTEVEVVKQSILDLYKDDLMKIREPTGSKARAIFKNIPSALSEHEKTFSPADIAVGSRSRDYINAIDWLSESKTVNICYRCTDPEPALDFHIDTNSFKVYMADSGLLMTMAFGSNSAKDEIYDMVLNRNLGLNRGMLFENVVAQELAAKGYRLAFSKRRSENNTYGLEVDFVIADGRNIVPIEVKSGERSSSHKSLDDFLATYGCRIERAYVIHPKNLRVDGKIGYIPIYMTMFI